MRTISVIVAGVAVIGASACHTKKDDGGLARDLARATSPDGIVLAPTGPTQTVVSAEEQLPPPRMHVARPQRSALHRVPHVDRTSPQLAILPATISPQPIDLPVVVTPRPHAIDVSFPSGTDPIGGIGSTGGTDGSSPGTMSGRIFGVVIRGGVAHGDHCDPRGAGQPGGGNISINTQMPPIHGTF